MFNTYITCLAARLRIGDFSGKSTQSLTLEIWTSFTSKSPALYHSFRVRGGLIKNLVYITSLNRAWRQDRQGLITSNKPETTKTMNRVASSLHPHPPNHHTAANQFLWSWFRYSQRQYQSMALKPATSGRGIQIGEEYTFSKRGHKLSYDLITSPLT